MNAILENAGFASIVLANLAAGGICAFLLYAIGNIGFMPLETGARA